MFTFALSLHQGFSKLSVHTNHLGAWWKAGNIGHIPKECKAGTGLGICQVRQVRSHLDEHCSTTSLAVKFFSCTSLILNSYLSNKLEFELTLNVIYVLHGFACLAGKPRLFTSFPSNLSCFFLLPFPFPWVRKRVGQRYLHTVSACLYAFGCVALTCPTWPSNVCLRNFKPKAVLNSSSASWGCPTPEDGLGRVGLNWAGLFPGTVRESNFLETEFRLDQRIGIRINGSDSRIVLKSLFDNIWKILTQPPAPSLMTFYGIVYL